jgi:hypothetical protein
MQVCIVDIQGPRKLPGKFQRQRVHLPRQTNRIGDRGGVGQRYAERYLGRARLALSMLPVTVGQNGERIDDE